MARKVFISVLGTGFYGKCRYVKEGFSSSETRFIQQATLEMLTQEEEWGEGDRGYILLTADARTKNWKICGGKREQRPGAEPLPYTGLCDEVSSIHLPFPVEDVDIPNGSNEAEIWEIFDVVFSKLQEGDELYFDLTHGFRYLPMLVLVLGNYAKFLKRAKVKSITYGNFESADKKVSPPQAPIVDVTPLANLQDWTSAASDFLRHGDASLLQECSMRELRPILCEAKGTDAEASNLRALAIVLRDFADELRFCRGVSLYEGSSSAKVRTYMEKVKGQYLKPLLPLLGDIRTSLDGFRSKEATNLLRASELCFEYGNYQASATLMQEGIVSILCLRHSIPVDDESRRGLVGKALEKSRLRQCGKLQEYKPADEADKEQKIEEVSQDSLFTAEFLREYSNLTKVRNDMNHAGMRCKPSPLQVNAMRKNVEKCLAYFVKDFSWGGLEGAAVPQKPTDRLFINLSNHPSSTWDEKQRAAAEELGGEIKDIAFPQVKPSDTVADIDKLAQDKVDKIEALAQDKAVTVHVMGEMALTYRLVRLLTSRGIRCVCSTSNRHVKDEGDGRRVVEFHFEQFRDYE